MAGDYFLLARRDEIAQLPLVPWIQAVGEVRHRMSHLRTRLSQRLTLPVCSTLVPARPANQSLCRLIKWEQFDLADCAAGAAHPPHPPRPPAANLPGATHHHPTAPSHTHSTASRTRRPAPHTSPPAHPNDPRLLLPGRTTRDILRAAPLLPGALDTFSSRCTRRCRIHRREGALGDRNLVGAHLGPVGSRH